MNYTSIEQSKKLLELGLNPETADMCWGLDAESGMYNNHPYPMPWKDYTAKSFYIPCWSVGALLTLLNYPKLDKDQLGDEDAWFCESYVEEFGEMFQGSASKTPIDACYNTVIYLLEHKLLKS